ncbi:WXG100 family type VII secretion target [Streptomyces sp. NPDC001002]
MSPSGNLQESSTRTYSNAISFLEDARTRMTTIQGQVSDAAATLHTNYQGADGQAYAQVMATWSSEVDRIKNTCMAMENQLRNSMTSSNKTQSHNNDMVNSQLNLSVTGSPGDNVYSTLTT